MIELKLLKHVRSVSQDQIGTSIDHGVSHLYRGRGHDLFFTPDEVALVFRRSDRKPGVVRLVLAGANPAAEPVGRQLVAAWSNYFSGGDPQQWQTDVPLYANLEYHDVYPGVDLVLEGTPGRLEYSLKHDTFPPMTCPLMGDSS